MFWVSIYFTFKIATFFPADVQRPAYWRGGGDDTLANEPTPRKYQILSNDGNAAILPICPLCAGDAFGSSFVKNEGSSITSRIFQCGVVGRAVA